MINTITLCDCCTKRVKCSYTSQYLNANCVNFTKRDDVTDEVVMLAKNPLNKDSKSKENER